MNIFKKLGIVSLTLLAVNKCVQHCAKPYSGEIIESLSLKEILSNEYNPLVSSFMAHLMLLHSDYYNGEDATVSIDPWILHMNTYGSVREYTINHINTPDSLACKFVWLLDTGNISGVGGLIDGCEYNVNAAALYFDQLIFTQQCEAEKKDNSDKYNQSNKSDKSIYLIGQ